MNRLYLIRHGQASFGTDDYDRLSALGVEQSRLLGMWFKRCGIDVHHAIAGGLKRHVQTAESFFDGYCESSDGDETAAWLPRIHRDPGFNETDQIDVMNPADGKPVGQLKDGTRKMTFDEFRENYVPAFYRWISGLHDHEYKQSFADFNSKCGAALEKAISVAGSGENVVTFTSGGTIVMLCRQILNLGDDATSALMWQIHNTSVSCLAHDRGRLVLTLFNSLAHLEHIADPGLITLT